MLERFHKRILRYVLGLRAIGDKPNGCGEDHILVGSHKGGKISRGTYFRDRLLHWGVIVQFKNTARAEKSRKSASPRPARRD
jgi:hypothetical protein